MESNNKKLRNKEKNPPKWIPSSFTILVYRFSVLQFTDLALCVKHLLIHVKKVI